MASVCGSTLALMDAGVPIKAPVAGIAMGLIKEGDEPRHPDRHPGRRGSPRRHGLQGRRHGRGRHHRPADGHQDHRRDARDPARRAGAGHARRGCRSSADDGRGASPSRARRSPSTPRRSSADARSHPTRSACSSARAARRSAACEDEYEVQIDIEEDGSVRIYGRRRRTASTARAHIEEMTRPIAGRRRVPASKRVVKTADFGAFVELRKGTDGLLHVSRVAPGVRIDSAEQVLQRRRHRRRRGDRGRQGARPHRAASSSRSRGRRRDHARADRRALQGAVPERRPAQRGRPPRDRDGDRGRDRGPRRGGGGDRGGSE